MRFNEIKSYALTLNRSEIQKLIKSLTKRIEKCKECGDDQYDTCENCGEHFCYHCAPYDFCNICEEIL